MASSERRLGEAFPPTKKYWKWPKRIRQRRWRSLRSRLMHRWKTIRKVLALLSSAPGVRAALGFLTNYSACKVIQRFVRFA